MQTLSTEKHHAAPEAGSGYVQIAYCREGRDFGGALETDCGIVRALPKLGKIFWLRAGDIFAQGFVLSEAATRRFAAGEKLAHLWLVPNPGCNPKGDFGLAPLALGASAHQQLALNRADV